MQYLALVDYLGNELPLVRSLRLIPGSTRPASSHRFSTFIYKSSISFCITGNKTPLPSLDAFHFMQPRIKSPVLAMPSQRRQKLSSFSSFAFQTSEAQGIGACPAAWLIY